MTSAPLSRRLALLAALTSSLILAACGGSGGSSGNGSTNVRALNLTSDLPSVDIFTGDTKRFSAANTDALTTSTSFEANTYTMNVKAAGDGATLLTASYSLAKDANYTAIVWGRQTALRLTTLPEDENTADIATGNTRVRMFNATTDTGNLDVYITALNADLGETAATQGALASGALSGFREISAGTYKLSVTGAGDPSDVRLVIPSITLVAKQFATLVLTAGSGGVLVNGTLIQQKGPATTLKNTKARVRVVASVDAGGNVASTFGNTTLVGSLRSPSVGPYALVDAGTNTLTMRINGSPFSTGSRNFAAGSDYTLLTYGTAAAGKLQVLTDDNRLPNAATRVKVRLVNGINNADPLTLSIDYLAVASDTLAGASSAYTTVNSNPVANLQVTSATSVDPLFPAPSASTTTPTYNLVGQGVYTVFMLSGNTSPTGTVRRER